MKLFKAKPIINKKNGQINFSIPKKKLPKTIKDMVNSNNIPIFRFKFDGIE